MFELEGIRWSVPIQDVTTHQKRDQDRQVAATSLWLRDHWLDQPHADQPTSNEEGVPTEVYMHDEVGAVEPLKRLQMDPKGKAWFSKHVFFS